MIGESLGKLYPFSVAEACAEGSAKRHITSVYAQLPAEGILSELASIPLSPASGNGIADATATDAYTPTVMANCLKIKKERL